MNLSFVYGNEGCGCWNTNGPSDGEGMYPDLGQELGLDAGSAPSPPQATLDEVNINMRKKPKYIECWILPSK